MLIKTPLNSELRENAVTDEVHYWSRRSFMQAGLALGGALLLPTGVAQAKPVDLINLATLNGQKTKHGLGLVPTAYKHITEYNNFYEFGTGKEEPAVTAKEFKTDPWSIEVTGHVEKGGKFALEDLLKGLVLEERIYRLRCVEAWSMVVPWVGFELGSLIKRFQPTSKAKFVRFETLHDPKQMPGQQRAVLQWPYVESLRMDEAMNPLTLLAVGLYGKTMPNQNGAPIRLVVPWKYGFKNIKSIVKISFEETQPVSSWEQSAPNEYGFYANVNPQVDHPRWSQKRERIIGSFARRETDMFNGYADQVASLYTGLDLRKYY